MSGRIRGVEPETGTGVSRRFVVWGAGGHGKVVEDAIIASGGIVTGFVDRALDRARALAGPDRDAFTEDAFLAALLDAGHARHAAIALAIGDNTTRLAALGTIGGRDAPAIIHSAATCATTARVGRGTLVCARAVLNPASVVGEAVIINTGAIVEHDCVVENGAHLSPGAILSGGVRVGARAWIGAGAVVIPGVTVGADAIVGAGAVIIRDVRAGTTVVGNPGRELRPR